MGLKRPDRPRRPLAPSEPRTGLARVLSKLGLCSRSQGEDWVRAGRVEVNGRVARDPEAPTRAGVDRIRIDGRDAAAVAPLYLMLNKPRGLVTTASDERGRDTVYRCFDGAEVGWIAPVGRLDQASEGLLLFSNDPQWAARITDPSSGPDKTYHVQVDAVPEASLLAELCAGIEVDGEAMAAKSIYLLRSGGKTAWLEVVLDEGRNRQIRRLLGARGLTVKRLIRVAIGPLALDKLGKGQWRALEPTEVLALAAPGRTDQAQRAAHSLALGPYT